MLGQDIYCKALTPIHSAVVAPPLPSVGSELPLAAKTEVASPSLPTGDTLEGKLVACIAECVAHVAGTSKTVRDL